MLLKKSIVMMSDTFYWAMRCNYPCTRTYVRIKPASQGYTIDKPMSLSFSNICFPSYLNFLWAFTYRTCTSFIICLSSPADDVGSHVLLSNVNPLST